VDHGDLDRALEDVNTSIAIKPTWWNHWVKAQILGRKDLPLVEKVGVDIVRRAIEEPIRMISENAGVEGSVVVLKVREADSKTFGYNALTDTYEDLVAAGIIDPTKVTRVALEKAASVASLLLTTECMIIEKPKVSACYIVTEFQTPWGAHIAARSRG